MKSTNRENNLNFYSAYIQLTGNTPSEYRLKAQGTATKQSIACECLLAYYTEERKNQGPFPGLPCSANTSAQQAFHQSTLRPLTLNGEQMLQNRDLLQGTLPGDSCFWKNRLSAVTGEAEPVAKFSLHWQPALFVVQGVSQCLVVRAVVTSMIKFCGIILVIMLR